MNSKGHIDNIGKYEYFIREGNLYRALLSNPIVNGYRLGARWQTKGSLITEYMSMIREAA